MKNIYKPRKKAPHSKNKNYIHYTKGGYNFCIPIRGISVLPNCVGYTWGRWRELLGDFHKLSRRNAEDWWGTNDGYERGQTPRLGSVICWRKGNAGDSSDGAGHVAIVEEINQNGSILTSNSSYGGSTFYLRTMKPPYNVGNSYTFQGFIYLPVDDGKAYLEKIEKVAREVLYGVWGNGSSRIKALKQAGYDPDVIQKEVNRIVFGRK